MPQPTVRYETVDQIAIITLNRPARLNAINQLLLEELLAALRRAAAHAGVSSVVLTGAGRSFCAGEDLKETAAGKTMDRWVGEIDLLQAYQRRILELGKPIVAAIRGYAVGGGLEFALSCDLRLATADAAFGFPETGVGLTVTSAGTKLISQIVGLGKAKELILTGELIDAEEALRIGLINRIVPDGELLEKALALCRKLNGRSSLALKLTRIAVDQGLHASFEQTLELEAAHLLACVAGGDQQAFVERRLARMKRGAASGGPKE
jgi:enoyl-CoA hydratase/carnithine racemase